MMTPSRIDAGDTPAVRDLTVAVDPEAPDLPAPGSLAAVDAGHAALARFRPDAFKATVAELLDAL